MTTVRIVFLLLPTLALAAACSRSPAKVASSTGGSSAGGQAAGGTSSAQDAGTSSGSGGSGNGGSTTQPGMGGATGGSGLGGGTSSAAGVGGSVPLGAGGTTGLGTGGSTRIGTGGFGGVSTGGNPGYGGAAGGETSSGGTTGAGGTTATGGIAGGATGTTGTGGAVGTGGGAGGGVTLSLDKTKQTMDGFGINDTWAEQSLPEQVFTTTGGGIGLSILRVGMGSDGKPMTSSALLSDIATAKANGVTTIIGTLWSGPNSCKSNNHTGGGHLLASCYESWATTVAAFAKDNGLSAMSIQNEPDYCGNSDTGDCSDNYPTMLYTADELVAFLKVVGPKLQALSPPVKVIAPETSEWLHLWTNNSATGSKDPLGGKYDYGHALYKDAEAWGLVDIVGTHQYETQVAEPWPNDVPDMKTVWMTEMSGIKGWPEQGPSSDIKNGVAVAGWIHDAIVNGMASAWLWWWYKPPTAGANDNEGLVLSDGTDTKRHYTLGNFSRFIRPGYARVDVTGAIPSDLLLSAYKGSDGTVVVVAINKGTSAIEVPIGISGGTAPTSLVPWLTSASDNLKSQTAVSVSDGSFTATLAGMTVTTFVGK